eukprot:268914_1
MTEEQKDILKQLETITSQIDDIAPEGSLQQLRNIFSQNAKNGKLMASHFEKAFHSLNIHCIKEEHIQSLFTHLVSQQTKSSKPQLELQIDPFMNKIKVTVPNHAHFTPKQICVCAMDEFMQNMERTENTEIDKNRNVLLSVP